MNENYLTIKSSGEYSETIKKSDFICSIKFVENENDAIAFINEISQKNNKATHNCFAYTLGIHDEIQRESDNGEPSGTAGVPILNALKQNHLHNVVAVVTRYFGGIKLGTGGLIRAYNGTTNNAIQAIGIVERIVMNQVIFELSYSNFEKAKYYFQQKEITIQNVEYLTKVKVTILLSKEQIEKFKNDFNNYFNQSFEFKIGEEKYVNIPFEKK